ncbi:MAG: alpha/beta hydrolase fold domain-containing protein, partial [Chitinophagales bacterium]
MKSFYFLLLFLCTFQLIAQNPDSCDGERYLTEIFTDVSAISGIKFGEGTTFGGEFQELFMDVYFPTGDLVEARPTIVLAFGGSFIFGERADLQGLCEAYARRGYVAATIDYRLYDGPLFPLPNEQDMQNVVIRAISDMKAAIRHLREDAATTNLYKIDPNYIFSGGVSAGAIVASHVAAMDETDEISPILQELVDENGGFEGNSSDNYEYSSAVQGCINLSGALNDAKLIDANDPPFISYHDDMDGVVPYAEGFATIFGVPIGYLEGSAAMHYVADSVGVENELYTIE